MDSRWFGEVATVTDEAATVVTEVATVTEEATVTEILEATVTVTEEAIPVVVTEVAYATKEATIVTDDMVPHQQQEIVEGFSSKVVTSECVTTSSTVQGGHDGQQMTSFETPSHMMLFHELLDILDICLPAASAEEAMLHCPGILANHDPEALNDYLPTYHLKDSRLQYMKKLGAGSFGEVYLCQITDEEGHMVQVAAKLAKVRCTVNEYMYC